MPDVGLTVALASGATIGAGLWMIGQSFVPARARLSDALAVLAPTAGTPAGDVPQVVLMLDSNSTVERAGAWIFQRFRLPLSARTSRLLDLQSRSIGDFYAEKLVLMLGGLVTPTLVAGLCALLGVRLGLLPLLVAVAVGAAGWLWPNLGLARRSETIKADAGEALMCYFDLVYLERLANKSATQALQSAAGVSEAAAFVRIRTALERARLQQRPPWDELRTLGGTMGMAEITDLADVMQLDEQGAALSEALAARVADLRDAHLMAEKIRAQEISERMSIWMALPVMIFALVLLAPPLLRLSGLA